MHRRTMGAAVLLASMAVAGNAEAQAIGVSLQNFSGRTTTDLADLATTNARPIGLAECDAELSFRFTNVDTSRSQLEFFEGASCEDVSVRTDTTSTMCNELPVPPDSIDMLSQQDIVIVARDLVPCDEAAGSALRNVFVLALSSPTDEVTGAGQIVEFPIAYDFDPPAAPGGLTVNPGESAAQLTWTAASGISSYDVFLDPTGCSATGELISPGLMSDPPDESLIVSSPASGASAATVPYPDGVATGQYVAVAIRAVDNAGNVSDLSTAVCVQRIEVISWWDMECGSGGPEYCSGGCTIARSSEGSAAWLGLIGVAAVLFVWRKKGRR